MSNPKIQAKIQQFNEALMDLNNPEIYELWGWIINAYQSLDIQKERALEKLQGSNKLLVEVSKALEYMNKNVPVEWFDKHLDNIGASVFNKAQEVIEAHKFDYIKELPFEKQKEAILKEAEARNITSIFEGRDSDTIDDYISTLKAFDGLLPITKCYLERADNSPTGIEEG